MVFSIHMSHHLPVVKLKQHPVGWQHGFTEHQAALPFWLLIGYFDSKCMRTRTGLYGQILDREYRIRIWLLIRLRTGKIDDQDGRCTECDRNKQFSRIASPQSSCL